MENALPAVRLLCKVLYVGKCSFPLPHFPHFVTHPTPFVLFVDCFVAGIHTDIRIHHD